MKPSTPHPSISSVSSSASSCATVIPARTSNANHNIEKSHTNSRNDTNLSSKETDPEESIRKRDSFADDDDSVQRNSVELVSLLSADNSQHLNERDHRVNSDYTSLSGSSTCDENRHTLTEGEELQLTDISVPPSETSESTAVESEYDYGFINSERNSYRETNEESYNVGDLCCENDDSYHTSEHRHPLVESGYDCNNEPLVENIRYYSTIIEESEEDESLVAPSSEAFGLKLKMGQYYSSNSGGADKNSKKKKKDVDNVNECRGSHTSSDGWRLSQTSTNSNVSSSTGGGDSDDTLGQNMSELSSINSHLSQLGQTSEDFKSLDRKEVNYSLQDSKNIKNDPEATPIATPIPPKRKSNTIIKNAIDELEIIEQAAQHLLQQSQTSPRSRSRKNMNPSTLQGNNTTEVQDTKRDIPTVKQVEHKTNNVNGYHIFNHNDTNKRNEQDKEKIIKEDVVTDNSDKVPPTEIKRRQWTKCTQLTPYISRESYNEDEFIKEIESLRGSYRESDLNDFLDKLESSGVKNSLNEDQYEQLIADIKADAERPNSVRGSKESLQMQAIIDKKVTRSSQESLTLKSKSTTMKRFERLKERILDLVRIKSKTKVQPKIDISNENTISIETNGVKKARISQSIDLGQNISENQELKRNESQNLEVKETKMTVEPAKSEYKKGFKFTEFLKGSPKLTRKKNSGEIIIDKHSVLIADNEMKDRDTANKNVKNILPKGNDDPPNSFDKKSATSSQELKKEVRFKLEVSSNSKEPVMKVCQPSNSNQIVQELSSDIENENITKKSLVNNKDYKDANKKEIILPATVAEINKKNELREDANSRAESLLPKLPERIKPPRRKKLKNLIPATVENISLDSFESLSQKSSDDSSAASPKNSSIFEKEIILEERLDTAPSLHIEKENLSVAKKYDHENLTKIKTSELQKKRITNPSNPTLEKTQQKIIDNQILNLPNKETEVLSSRVEESINTERRKETIKGIDPSKEGKKETTNVIREEIVSHNTSVPSIAIECIDSIIKETADGKQKYNLLAKDTTPGFPETDETMTSFYDNVNPYHEVMSKLEEEVEDVTSYFESKKVQEKDGIKLEFKVVDRIKSFEKELAMKSDNNHETAKNDNVFSPMENSKPKEYTYQKNDTEHLINFLNTGVSNKPEIDRSHQEAFLSPENESKVYCIDDLNILTEEIARIANDMELDMQLQNQDAENVQDKLISKVQNNYVQHNGTRELSRQEAETLFTQTESSRRKDKRKMEIAPQTDTEFDETEFETESELDDATLSRVKQKQTNPFFGPSTAYSRNETLLSTSERSLETILPNKKPPAVPPRHFQQKMPLNVVKELKSVLSENGEESRLKKPELPPRWDSILTYNNGRCLSDVSNNNNNNNDNNNNNNIKLSNSSLHETSNLNSGQVSVSAADPQSEQPLLSFPSSNNVTSSNLITSSVIKYTKQNCNRTVERPKSYSETSENLAPIPVETLSTVVNFIQEKDDVPSQTSFLKEIIGHKNSKNPAQKLSIRRVRANVYPFFGSLPQVSIDNLPVPHLSNMHCLKLNPSIEEGYMSDPGPINKQDIRNTTIEYGSVTDCDAIQSSKNNVLSDMNICKIDIIRPEITTVNNNVQNATCSYMQLPPRPPLPLEIKLLYNDKSDKSKITNLKQPLPIHEINFKESPIILRKSNEDTKLKPKPLPLSSDSYILNTSHTSCQENIYSFVDSRLQSISLSARKPNEEDPKEENNKVIGNSGTLPENKQTCNILRQRPLTWCTQSDFNAEYMLRTQTIEEGDTYKTNIENPLLDNDCNKENPLSNPSSQLSQCSSQRLQAQGLGEWLFLARLDHTNQLLSQLKSAMQLQLDRSPGEISEYNEKSIQNSEKSSSPPPPPRPRTPIDERDPEQVYAERRYLSYFEGGPRAKHSAGDEPPKPPTYQQVAAQKRYANYFIGPPQANPEKLRFSSPDLENDKEVLDAKRRYEGYFKSGPPRPKSYNEPEKTPEDDAVTIQAKQRYDSYFKSNIPRTRSEVSEEKYVEPDEAQLAAEKRYLLYFQSGPPRSRSTVSEEKFAESDEVQKAAEKRYLSYFHPGPPRNRTTVSEEKYTEPDEQQKAAEKRYLSYFQPGPPRPRSYTEDTGPQEPDEEQIEAEKRYAKYFEGLPKAKHEHNEELLRPRITAEMVAAEERFLKYFDPIPYGAPKKIIPPPPPSEEEMKKKQLFLEFQSALESRVCRKQMKIVKVSKPKKEHSREKTPPTLRDIVVDEFLKRVQDRKKEKDLHFGDTDDEDEEDDIYKALPKTVSSGEPVIQGGGTVDRRISCDLQLFVKEEEVWSPGGARDGKIDGPSKLEASDLPSFKDVPPVWTPARAGSASPSFGRKEYKKLHFEGSTLHRKTSQENVNVPRPEESFAWKDREAERLKSALPRVQSPTVTLLQKKREGQIPGHRPDYMQQEESYYKPGDKLYTIKREYESEDEESGSRKFAVLGPRKIEGVGPTTRDGVPVTLKSGVKSEHQGEWYRRMFDSLHKVRDDPLSHYKSRARYGGYMSEPEGYDSDIGSSRYISLDRRNKKFEVDVTETHPKNTKRYAHQPGRIENYIPGFSSLSEKELRDNPEADVKLEIKTKDSAPVTSSHRFGSSRMQMSNALKDTGYESDSTLVFRKREDQRRKFLDPNKSSQIYKQVQLGGEIPLTGLQKPAPPRPKESPFKYNSSEVNIHYRTPVRVEQKESLSEEELARRQEEHMKKVYENERRKKYLSELEDIERRRHTDNFTPLQKSPIPLNRYDDETFGGPIGAKTPEPKQVARALFNFSAQNKRELSFNKGDIVTIRRCIDRNWYEGEVRGVVGIFPCNYVEVVPFDSLKTLGRRASEGQARVRFNFQAQTAMEMSLTKGEMVILTRRVDENWYEGRVGNRRGIFPVTYVDVLIEPGGDRPISPSREPMPRPALPAAHLLFNGTSGVSSPYSTMGHSNQSDHKAFTQLTVNTQQDSVPYRALYNYKPQNEDELELIEGDIALVMEKCDDGWFVGTSKRTGLFGTFPGNYVERC